MVTFCEGSFFIFEARVDIEFDAREGISVGRSRQAYTATHMHGLE